MSEVMTRRKGWNLEPTISESEARELTEQIRTAADELWKLLVRAHETKAWKALGYKRWADYIGGEFHHTRQWSYRLLDQGEVIREIEAAAGVSPAGVIDERTARDIKPVLSVVTEDIAARISEGQEPQVAISETVAAARELVSADTPRVPRGPKMNKRSTGQLVEGTFHSLGAVLMTLRQMDMTEIAVDDDRGKEWCSELDEVIRLLRALRTVLREGGAK